MNVINQSIFENLMTKLNNTISKRNNKNHHWLDIDISVLEDTSVSFINLYFLLNENFICKPLFQRENDETFEKWIQQQIGINDIFVNFSIKSNLDYIKNKYDVHIELFKIIRISKKGISNVNYNNILYEVNPYLILELQPIFDIKINFFEHKELFNNFESTFWNTIYYTERLDDIFYFKKYVVQPVENLIKTIFNKS